jgi:putative flippase GtrA
MQALVEKLLESSAIRFLLGGGVTVVAEYAVFYALYVGLHWNLFVSNSLSFGVGLAVSFMFNRLWAFKQDDFRRKAHHQAALYVILALTNLLLNNAIVGGLNSLSLDPRIGKVIAIILIAAWNFVIYRKIIFTGRAYQPQPGHDS